MKTSDSGTLLAQGCGVNPSVETVWNWHTCANASKAGALPKTLWHRWHSNTSLEEGAYFAAQPAPSSESLPQFLFPILTFCRDFSTTDTTFSSRLSNRGRYLQHGADFAARLVSFPCPFGIIQRLASGGGISLFLR